MRTMADAPSSNIANIPGNIDVVAGYVTGTADIQWTAADFARFPGAVSIDQGFQSPPVTTATVRDVEPNAWTPLFAVELGNWTAARRTIYCDLYDLTRPGGVLGFGWRGDLWLAMPGWQPGENLPVTPGCTVVAVQNQQDVNGVDLSVVLDPTWPEADVNNGWHFIQGASGKVYLLDGGKMSHIGNPADVAAITNGQPVSAACEAQLLADFPPGDPTVTVGNVTFPTYTVTPNP